ncbi:MAG: ketoacyl-ACP synthase III [Candidatus Dadabacteria bacterium]|nr:ketoacyl-ACP synthase III [Candidatus Dadabacteria bacterium]
MKYVKIIGTGSSVPDTILSNSDLEKMVETSDEWIISRTGIKERRIADKDTASSDIAYEAAEKALKAASVNPSDLDVIIVGTITPDFLFPSTGCVVQGLLGAKKAYAFDLMAGCSGFLYTLHVAQGIIKSGAAEKILVIGVDTLSKVTDFEDRSTCILFGDGAGAAVLTASDEPGILSSILNSDGRDWDLLYVPAGGSRTPINEEVLKTRDQYIKMEGNDVFKVAVKSMESATINAIQQADITPEDIDLFVPHQANQRILEAVRKRLNFPEEKVFVNLDKYGNTSGASVPLALDEAIRQGRVKEGNLVLFAAFGAGFTWGASVVRL